MLRIKLPGGRATPAQLRTIGELSNRYGRGDGELSTRQTIQLHYLELALAAGGVRRARRRRADHRRRLRRRGPQHHRLPGRRRRRRRALRRDAARRRGGRVLLRQPGLLRPAAQAQDLDRRLLGPLQRARDQLHLARRRRARGRAGFAVLVGGGLSSVPRIARDLGVFIRQDEALEVLRALLDAWKEDLRYRVSRVKARLKFMVDDYGPEGIRAEVERRLGRTLPDYTLPPLDHEPPGTSASTRRARAGPRLRRRPGARRPRQRRPAARARRPRRGARRRRPRHAPAELRADERARGRGRRRRPRGSPRSASRSTSTSCAPARSRAPASRTATSR